MKEIWRILSYTKYFKKYYISMSGFIILIALLTQAAPLLTKQIVDIIVANLKGQPASFTLLVVFLGLILLSDVLITILTDISQYIGDIMTIRLNNFLSEKILTDTLLKLID